MPGCCLTGWLKGQGLIYELLKMTSTHILYIKKKRNASSWLPRRLSRYRLVLQKITWLQMRRRPPSMACTCLPWCRWILFCARSRWKHASLKWVVIQVLCLSSAVLFRSEDAARRLPPKEKNTKIRIKNIWSFWKRRALLSGRRQDLPILVRKGWKNNKSSDCQIAFFFLRKRRDEGGKIDRWTWNWSFFIIRETL